MAHEVQPMLRQLFAEFTCPICSRLYQEPIQSSVCSHAFCRQCILEKIEGRGITTSECPTCHQPVWKKDLLENRKYARIVGILHKWPLDGGQKLVNASQGEAEPHGKPVADGNTHQDAQQQSTAAGEVRTLEGWLPAERLKRARGPTATRRASEASGENAKGQKRLNLQLTGSEEAEKVANEPQIHCDERKTPASNDSAGQPRNADPRPKPVTAPAQRKGRKSSKHARRRKATAQSMAAQEEGEDATVSGDAVPDDNPSEPAPENEARGGHVGSTGDVQLQSNHPDRRWAHGFLAEVRQAVEPAPADLPPPSPPPPPFPSREAAASQGAVDTIPETPSQSLRPSSEQQVQPRMRPEAAALDTAPDADPDLLRILDATAQPGSGETAVSPGYQSPSRPADPDTASDSGFGPSWEAKALESQRKELGGGSSLKWASEILEARALTAAIVRAEDLIREASKRGPKSREESLLPANISMQWGAADIDAEMRRLGFRFTAAPDSVPPQV